MDWTGVTAAAATFASTSQLIPQVLKARSLDSIAGLSATWAAVGVALNLGWLGYRWSQELWLGLLSPAVASILYLVLFAMIIGARKENTVVILLSFAAFAAAIGSAILGGWIAVGALLGVGSVVHIWPSVWAVFWSSEVRAVSVGTWSLGLAQAVLWAVYGWGSGDSIHLLYGLATAPGAVAILARYVFLRHQRRSAARVKRTLGQSLVAPSLAIKKPRARSVRGYLFTRSQKAPE